ncbi:hypothetical protein RhiirA4_467406 [Rhizophagus irregularis]|uniref:Uncharacterized protein n=1 Tax=Rhizophagus irregularis TaxID=588596 RepID=A0A2I1GVX2_9GLOM|nr:hypothetical protein RhiirA4_467406 [Rhizophagus irregularis]
MSINFYTDADGVTLSVKNNWVEALPLLYESLIQLSIFKKCVLRKKLNIEKSLKEWGPVKYRPHYVSNNKLHAGRMIVNKYAKGKAKYEHYESNKSGNIDENDVEDE